MHPVPLVPDVLAPHAASGTLIPAVQAAACAQRMRRATCLHHACMLGTRLALTNLCGVDAGVANIMAYSWPSHCKRYLDSIEAEKRYLRSQQVCPARVSVSPLTAPTHLPAGPALPHSSTGAGARQLSGSLWR